MALFPGTPKLESRKCPETIPGGVPGLWELITPDWQVWSQRGLNQTCSPRRDLSNNVSHSQFGGREKVDPRLFVVGNQTASLTPGPSFAHNLGDRCPNGQCEAIFHIYASRPFERHQEHLNARCFGPCCRTLNIWESRRTPNPHFFQVLGFTPTLGQSRVATPSSLMDSIVNPKVKIMEREWVGVCSLACNILKIEGHVGVSGLELRRLTSKSIIHTNQTNQTKSWLVRSYNTFGAQMSHE